MHSLWQLRSLIIFAGAIRVILLSFSYFRSQPMYEIWIFNKANFIFIFVIHLAAVFSFSFPLLYEPSSNDSFPNVILNFESQLTASSILTALNWFFSTFITSKVLSVWPTFPKTIFFWPLLQPFDVFPLKTVFISKIFAFTKIKVSELFPSYEPLLALSYASNAAFPPLFWVPPLSYCIPLFWLQENSKITSANV